MPIHCGICGVEKHITKDFKKWPAIGLATTDIYPVTNRAKPDGELHGFICASCLNSAKSMRLYIKGLMKGIKVTDHAVERFILRFTKGDMAKDGARSSLIKMFSNARKIRFKDFYMVKRIFNNNFKGANYYYNNGLIYVATTERPPTIVTVESAKDKKLGTDFWYDD